MEISSAITSISAALGLAKSAIEARDEAKINAAIAEINRKHIDLSTVALQLVEKNNALLRTNHELESKLAEIQRKASERENYAMHELASGRFVYRLKPANDNGEPVHDLCQICYDQGIKSVLRLQPGGDWSSRHYACAAVENGAHDLYF